MNETAIILTSCLKCGNEIKIQQVWTPGGMNDYGGWVIECGKCSTKMHIRIGRDVNDSNMISGGKKLDSYDDEIGNQTEVLGKYCIKE